MTAEFSMSNNLTMVNRLVIVLGRRFCLSHHQNTRKGGLLGLAAVMVGFKNGSMSEPPPEMIEEVVRPVLTCLLDSDPRVRHYACEALFNVTKVARNNILPQFELIFDSLSKMVADNDMNVKVGAEALDRLLKDIIVETNELKLDDFVRKLEEYIYTKDQCTRMFIISWIRLLDSKMDIVKYLPHLLDGILNCLYDSNNQIRASILVVLSEFLNKIVTRPSDETDLSALVKILLKHTRTDRESPVQYTSIAWIRQMIRLMDGNHLLSFTPGILAAILPCLAYQPNDDVDVEGRTAVQRSISAPVDQGNICEISTLVNSSLQELVINVLCDRKNTANSEPIFSDLAAILEVLSSELKRQEHPVIRLAILDWFRALREAEPEFISLQLSQPKLFQPLLDTLSARSDAVVKNALRVITEIFHDEFTLSEDQQQQRQSTSGDDNQIRDEEDLENRKSLGRNLHNRPKSPMSSASKRVAITTSEPSNANQCEPSIHRFIRALYKTFRDNELVFDDRGQFIIVNLCTMIAPDRVYNSFAEIIKEEKVDLKFAYNLVQKLNQILLTTQPLAVLRSRLSNDEEPEVMALFHSLYLAWCHSPIAAITLCLLANHHRHANEIVVALSRADITVELMIQIDWIVQLIESPVFAPLRIRLLDSGNNHYLIQALYGLLMILPQSEAYRKLSNRLNQVHRFMSLNSQTANLKTTQTGGLKQAGSSSSSTSTQSTTGQTKEPKKAGSSLPVSSSSTSLEALMKHFYNVQNLRTKHMLNRNIDVD
jgi:vacuole morphology and inheritance protein 14